MRTILDKGGAGLLRPGFVSGGGNCARLFKINERRDSSDQIYLKILVAHFSLFATFPRS
jgi:hypothetical protein